MAEELYGGRSFVLARDATRTLDGRLYIVSAGLGVVRYDERVPAYSLTVAGTSADNVFERISDAGDTSAADWWDVVCRLSCFGTSIRDVVRRASGQHVLIALPSTYLSMIADDLAKIPESALRRVRVFTRSVPADFPDRLRAFVMPYDDRLDGPDSPITGTRSDFAARALSHFSTKVLKKAPRATADSHRRAVRAILSRWRHERIIIRSRRSDEELVRLIRSNWTAAGGRKTRLLRILRDDIGIACEQSRFSRLVAVAQSKVST